MTEGQKSVLLCKPTTDKVIPVAEAFYHLPDHGTGGPLHIVLDDENIDVPHIEYSRECALDPGFWANGGKINVPGVFLCDVLLMMSKTQRSKVSRGVRAATWDDMTEPEFWQIAEAHLPELVSAVKSREL